MTIAQSQFAGPWDDAPEAASSAGGAVSSGRPWRVVASAALGGSGSFRLAMEQFEPAGRALLTVVAAAAFTAGALHLSRWRTWSFAVPVALAGALFAIRAELVIGITSAFVTFAGTAAAFAAISEFGPWPRWPRRRSSVAGLALPFIVLGEVLWSRDHLAAPTAMILLGLGAAATVLYQLAPDAVAHVDAGVARTLHALSNVVGSIVLFAVCVPLLYLPGAIARLVSAVHTRALRAEVTSTWQSYGAGVSEERRDAAWLFATTPRAERRRRSAASLAVVVFIAGLTWTAAGDMLVSHEVKEVQGGTTSDGSDNFILALENVARYSQLPSMIDAYWADELQDAENRLGDEYDVTSRYVNVKDGVRRTIAAPTCDCKRLVVWLIGGSTAWGQGQRDDHTIASELVRVGQADGVSIHLTNLGSRGSTMRGEINTVADRLRSHEAPDLLLVYGGFNDALTNVTSEFATGTRGPFESMSFDHLVHINGRLEEFLDWPDGAAAGRRAADRMLEDRARIEQLASQYDFEAAYIFQPDALTNPVQLTGYDAITGLDAATIIDSPIGDALEAASVALRGPFVDVRHLFDRHPEPVFIGLVHHNEAASAIVAQTVYDRLEADIRRLSH